MSRTILNSILLCFVLGNSAASALAQPVETEEVIDGWQLIVSTDPFNDLGRGIAARAGAQGEMLVVKCDTGGTRRMYVSFIADEYLGAGRYSTRNVDLRFDGNPAFSQRWYHDDMTASIFDQVPVEVFVSQLLVADTLAIRVTDFEFGSHTYVIDVSNSRAAVSRAYEACGQRLPTGS